MASALPLQQMQVSVAAVPPSRRLKQQAQASPLQPEQVRPDAKHPAHWTPSSAFPRPSLPPPLLEAGSLRLWVFLHARNSLLPADPRSNLRAGVRLHSLPPVQQVHPPNVFPAPLLRLVAGLLPRVRLFQMVVLIFVLPTLLAGNFLLPRSELPVPLLAAHSCRRRFVATPDLHCLELLEAPAPLVLARGAPLRGPRQGCTALRTQT